MRHVAPAHPSGKKGAARANSTLRRARHSGSVLTMTTPHQQLCIGVRISGEPVTLDAEERRRHLYLVGQTGTGKSTVLLNLIHQDLIAGEGLALLDPHGDLAEAVLALIPRARTNDLVYINPADAARPIGFNPLARVPDDLKSVAADGVVSAFRPVNFPPTKPTAFSPQSANEPFRTSLDDGASGPPSDRASSDTSQLYKFIT
jgi:DNA helicase HerA-like ATPase